MQEGINVSFFADEIRVDEGSVVVKLCQMCGMLLS
jgi:hypothetical protein